MQSPSDDTASPTSPRPRRSTRLARRINTLRRKFAAACYNYTTVRAALVAKETEVRRLAAALDDEGASHAELLDLFVAYAEARGESVALERAMYEWQHHASNCAFEYYAHLALAAQPPAQQ